MRDCEVERSRFLWGIFFPTCALQFWFYSCEQEWMKEAPFAQVCVSEPIIFSVSFAKPRDTHWPQQLVSHSENMVRLWWGVREVIASTSPVILGPNHFWKENGLRGNSWFIHFLKAVKLSIYLELFSLLQCLKKRSCRIQALTQEAKWHFEMSGGTEVVLPCLQKSLIHAFTMFFQTFVNGFFLLPHIQWPGPIPCIELEQTMVYFTKVITYGSWLESIVQWCRQIRRNMLGGESYVNIKSNLKLSNPNSGLKSGLIFPPEVLRKLSLASQIPNLKRGHALWNWRLTTDVDSYTWFSGFSKWQIYSIRTFKFYCRWSHLVTFGWLSVKHLHTGSVALSRGERQPLPSVLPAEGRAGAPRPALLPASSRGSSAAAPRAAAPLRACSCSPGRRDQGSNHWASPCAACAGTATGKGKWCRVSARRSALLGVCCCLWRCAWRWELLALLFLSPSPLQDLVRKFACLMLKWVCGKCCNTLSGKMPFEPIGGFHEVWKEGRWTEGK